jgi:hypothetical protein
VFSTFFITFDCHEDAIEFQQWLVFLHRQIYPINIKMFSSSDTYYSSSITVKKKKKLHIICMPIKCKNYQNCNARNNSHLENPYWSLSCTGYTGYTSQNAKLRLTPLDPHFKPQTRVQKLKAEATWSSRQIISWCRIKCNTQQNRSSLFANFARELKNVNTNWQINDKRRDWKMFTYCTAVSTLWLSSL